ncbi:MAG: hypothetical protein PHD82_17435 [Candidatus Riflebacteria bacterium]|nr:hypothetical protein [Candidatus Riflebacteria bacterium]
MTTQSSAGKTLNGRIVAVDALTAEYKDSMYRLMHEFYQVARDSFFSDLSRKTSVILLEDTSGKLRGFTSAAIYDLEAGTEKVKILFSGDTIIHSDYWGSLELPRVWGHFMFETLQSCGSVPLFWFLISSGYRTYRFLPAYFVEFFPRFDRPTPPDMQKILDAAAKSLFSESYDAKTGIVRLSNPTPLRAGISEPAAERLQNQHISFFLQKNPGHEAGDELACLTRLHWDNFKPFVKRLLKN